MKKWVILSLAVLIIFIGLLAFKINKLEQEALAREQAILALQEENELLESENVTLGKKVTALTLTVNSRDETILELTNSIETIKQNYEKEIAEAKVERLSDSEYQILAKLLFCEAGGSSRDGMIYTCSAILNLRDHTGRTIMEMAHDNSTFSVARIVDSAKPTEKVYEVIDYVLQGHRVPDICYFRTNHYHSFGIPVCKVGGHYFSRPD